jgi:hypothetical protein
MESLQLHLTGAARSWLGKLKKETIGSWDKLAKQFIGNFKSTYKRLPSTGELKACTQKTGETLRSYIKRWSVIKNSVQDVSDERAIDAFTQGIRRADFTKEMDRIKPKIVVKLMEVENRFADGEDTYHNKRTRSPKDDRSNRYNNQTRRSRNYDNYNSHSQVAAGYKENNNQGDDHQNSGYRNDNRDDAGSNKQFRPRNPRDYNKSPDDMLNGPWHMHYTYIDGKRV